MIEFRAERGWSFNGYQAWILDRRNGQTFIAKPMELVFEPIGEGCQLPEPTLKIHSDFAEQMIPQLRKALAGFAWFEKEDYDQAARVEKSMQAHIDSLKFVVERTVK